MERTMRRFKEAMVVVSIPPALFIETKTKQRKQRTSVTNNKTTTKSKSFSIGSGQVQRRLFSKPKVLLKETTNANSATVLAKGTLTDKSDKENRQRQRQPPQQSSCCASSMDASFDLELDDSDYEYERINNSLLQEDDDHNLVGELSDDYSDDDDDESEISSIGIPGELTMPPIVTKRASRLLLAASFPPTPASVNTTTTTTTATPAVKEFSLWKNSSNNATTTTKRTTNATTNSTAATGNTLAEARSQMALGHTHMQQKDYAAAKTVLLDASCLYEELHGPNHTSVALALDAHALACLKLSLPKEGLAALERAFQIKCHTLGVWHVDTVDTYNKMASVHLQLGNYQTALAHYQQVLEVRTAILGPHHPSVAITAHALAKVHRQLGHSMQAQAHFDLAKTIYEQLGMRYNHKDMASLLMDEHYLANGGVGSGGGNGIVHEIAEF